jgi:hypothetical protein
VPPERVADESPGSFAQVSIAFVYDDLRPASTACALISKRLESHREFVSLDCMADAFRTLNSTGDLRAELAEILAAGVLRLRAKQSSTNSSDCGECSLDFSAKQSVHADPVTKRLGRHDE